MATEARIARATDMVGLEGLPIIDADVHNGTIRDAFLEYLPKRWRDYVDATGIRWHGVTGAFSTQRPLACRLDAMPPRGGPAASDPEFAREQLLDEYGLSAAILSCIETLAGGNIPVELDAALNRAMNDYNHDVWFPDDPRWLSSIVVPINEPELAVAEIARCAERSDRFVQVHLNSRGERPLGNPKYWPVWEAAAHYGLPVSFHVGVLRHHGVTGIGSHTTYYYEVHTGFSLAAQALTASLVFEGVFERFPSLKIVLTELAWAWAVPFAWRMDATWRVLKNEVAHLERKPSEYFRDHFWFTTQPAEEPEHPQDIYGLWEQFEEFGFGDKLMFATDYPHWDFDPPSHAIPAQLPLETKRRLLAGNASALYGIPLEPANGA